MSQMEWRETDDYAGERPVLLVEGSTELSKKARMNGLIY
jgi:hypothetical protein